MRRFIISVFVASLMVPAFSSALTIDQIQQQIATLLAQVAQLQQQISQLSVVQATTTPAVTPPTSSLDIVCPVFNSTLSRGGRGDAVSALQKFLADRGFLTSEAATGFYGPLTESAVRNFQSQQGIVTSGDAETTGWGAVGKLTSAAIVRVCSSQTSNPTPGSKNPNACATVPVPSTSCDGTWTAAMDSRSCVASWQCVSSPTACTMQMLLCPTGQHRVVNGCSQSCVNDTPATCPAVLRAACPTGQHYQFGDMRYDTYGCSVQDAKCVPDDSSGAPVITSVDGPATLNANQSGTWTVRASVPNQSNASIRYSVTWGDEVNWAYSVASGAAQASSAITTSGTFTHAFNYAGNFTPVFTVNNDSGSASFKTSVQVSGGGLINCPVYAQSSMIAACPLGQHWESSKPTYDANNCPMPYSGKCVPDVPTSATFSASPTSGAVPLTVGFYVSNFTGTTDSYSIDFGDGSGTSGSLGWSRSFDGANLYMSHTYTVAGTYTAKLMYQAPFTCSAGLMCTQMMPALQTIGTVTITVGGTSGTPSVSVSVSPGSVVQGSAPLTNGGSAHISWSSVNAPADSAVQFSLVRNDGKSYGTVWTGSNTSSGSGDWAVPGPQCDSTGSCVYQTDSNAAYFTDPGTYYLVAKLYTPANACLGFCMIANSVSATVVASSQSSTFTITH